MKHIILKVTQDQFKTLKTTLKEVKDTYPKVAISPVKQGNLGDDIMASFTVDDEHYQHILNKLDQVNIRLVGDAGKKENKRVPYNTLLKPQLENNKQEEKPEQNIVKQVPQKNTPSAILEAAIINGEYDKVIQMSKDFHNGFDVIKKAKDGLDTAIKNSIELAYSKALTNKFDVNNCLKTLINIASDKDLKNLRKTELMKAAGIKAVDLCYRYNEYINILVQICNNNIIPHIVCMKAAIKLAYLLSDENEKAQENTDYASRYLNLRWMNIVFYTVSNEITEKEKEIYRVLITSIKEKFEDKESQA